MAVLAHMAVLGPHGPTRQYWVHVAVLGPHGGTGPTRLAVLLVDPLLHSMMQTGKIILKARRSDYVNCHNIVLHYLQ